MIKIFNTITRRKEILKPNYAGKVTLYVCGVTVYDLCHIGHGRTFVIFDMVIRYLRYRGYQVHYVRNITDIDKKILQRSAENRESYHTLTNRMINEMHYDFDKLNILRPHAEPRATQHITTIIELVSKLLEKGHAYVAINGDVIFSVDTNQHYGVLSHQNVKTIPTSFEEVNVNNIKRNPRDFVLWKKYINDYPSWSSPWGQGRPGWHIECSAMSWKTLGTHFDIHGGGVDLIFPHHENEIAQSTCCHGPNYVNLWMHSGMIRLNGEKMSKSLGNVLTLRNIMQYYNAETVRYFLLSRHYRSPLDYSENRLREAQSSLKRLYIALQGTDNNDLPIGGEDFINQFVSAMDDDFNTPKAYAVLFDMAREINRLKLKNPITVKGIAARLRQLAGVLGLLNQDTHHFLKHKIIDNSDIDKDTDAVIDSLIQKRNEARKNNQWILADTIREQLQTMNIILEDSYTHTIWYRK